jgi:aryl-alcohol dehydrogenase-like predicted oxidoreductase
MNYRKFGNTGLLVSELCMGTMTFGGAGSPSFDAIGALGQADADKLVHKAVDAGINFFDTADAYARHESEEILGKALGDKRKEVIVATKVRFRMSDNVNSVGLTRHHIMNNVEDSLKALNTDYIDLYQIHSSDAITDMEETMRALNDLVVQGKVRYIGYCNLTAWQAMKALSISRQHGWHEFKSAQVYYSIAGRELEREIVPMALDQNIAILPWSPLAGGFLSGKYTREFEKVEGSRRTNFDFPPINKEQAYDIIEVMQAVAKAHDATVARVALAWLLHQQGVTSVIIGAKKMYQLEDNLKAVDLKLTEDELNRLNTVSQLSPEYPHWFGAMPSDRMPGGQAWG